MSSLPASMPKNGRKVFSRGLPSIHLAVWGSSWSARVNKFKRLRWQSRHCEVVQFISMPQFHKVIIPTQPWEAFFEVTKYHSLVTMWHLGLYAFYTVTIFLLLLFCSYTHGQQCVCRQYASHSQWYYDWCLARRYFPKSARVKSLCKYPCQAHSKKNL